MAKLTAMGFKLGTPEYIPGEEDWVYGILVKGKHVVAGDKVSIDDVLVIQVGNGKRSVDDSIDVVDPVYHGEEDVMEGEGDMSGEKLMKTTSRWFLERKPQSLLLRHEHHQKGSGGVEKMKMKSEEFNSNTSDI